MTKKNNILLPEGFKDLLIDEALAESQLVRNLLDTFQKSGYEIIKPPLIENEDSILDNVGFKLEENMFKFIDPKTQNTLCLRSDITIQVSRIVSSHLSKLSRPLRLSYSGDILRIKTSQIRPERQFTQTGFELIGEKSFDADIEVITLAVDSLKQVGVPKISIDLTLPTFIDNIFEDLDFSEKDKIIIRDFLDKKDLASLKKLELSKETDIFEVVLNSIGPVENALNTLNSLKLNSKAKDLIFYINNVYEGIKKLLPDVSITIDLSEYNGFEYHTGIGFTLFSPLAKFELGKGGRYLTSSKEDAVGFSIYLDSLIKIAVFNIESNSNRILLPAETTFQEAKELRDAGWLTVKLFKKTKSILIEAKNLRCSYVYFDKKPKSLKQMKKILE
ncbi:MAG: ATP phosphoribosyltransferase regulatory subunit [Alphaproteobacteria bacterium MarineAlpha2_Bin1]|nr:MAG: ATP phosphoribosyltransferase regulatory subunit [Alphaproteobacteria bacterium MarineAlpha2_Bin1]